MFVTLPSGFSQFAQLCNCGLVLGVLGSNVFGLIGDSRGKMQNMFTMFYLFRWGEISATAPGQARLRGIVSFMF